MYPLLLGHIDSKFSIFNMTSMHPPNTLYSHLSMANEHSAKHLHCEPHWKKTPKHFNRYLVC